MIYTYNLKSFGSLLDFQIIFLEYFNNIHKIYYISWSGRRAESIDLCYCLLFMASIMLFLRMYVRKYVLIVMYV